MQGCPTACSKALAVMACCACVIRYTAQLGWCATIQAVLEQASGGALAPLVRDLLRLERCMASREGLPLGACTLADCAAMMLRRTPDRDAIVEALRCAHDWLPAASGRLSR